MISSQYMNNMPIIYDHNKTNQNCYDYNELYKDHDSHDLKKFMKMCDILLMFFALIMIGVQYLKLFHAPKDRYTYNE